MANLNTEVSISTATTSEHYFPILSTSCSELRLQILRARDGDYIGSDCTRKQRPRLQLMLPESYIPPAAMTGDAPCDGVLFTLDPRGNSGMAKCQVRLSKSASSRTHNIVCSVTIPYFGTVHDLLNVTRDVFGEGDEKFKYRMSNGWLHGGRDFWLQVLIECHNKGLIGDTDVGEKSGFWESLEYRWPDRTHKRIKNGRFFNEASRQDSVQTQQGNFPMYYQG
ncbi:hypothetical protein EV127DRAFT_488026 [Xylaria flabelliformis]|nr:hypothetical protein EV127DRAFT_488026 [Xylaria flabelliformis]